MDILTLRSTLASALASRLGTYTLPNGSTTAALVVRDPGQGMTAGTSVSGLEVVISSVPELEQRLQYQSSPFVQTWNVFLIDWGGADLEGAAAVVQSGFPGTTATILPVTEDIGPKRQSQLRIPLAKEGGQSAFMVPPTLEVQSVNGETGHVVLGLGDLSDVSYTGLTDDAVLVWDAASSSWKVNQHTTLTLTDGGHW